jgi:hypothetical protein
MTTIATRIHRNVYRSICGSLVSGVSLLAILWTSAPLGGQEQGAGAVVSSQVTAKDVGLPLYPGSKPHKEEGNDSQAAQLGLWGGGSGFKLVVLKMESNDPPEKVAQFYKKALGKYGAVLDCTDEATANKDAAKDDTSKVLTCGDDKPDKGGMLFKAGTKEKQHIAWIQPNGHGSVYQLVFLNGWSAEKKK